MWNMQLYYLNACCIFTYISNQRFLTIPNKIYNTVWSDINITQYVYLWVLKNMCEVFLHIGYGCSQKYTKKIGNKYIKIKLTTSLYRNNYISIN